MAISSLKILIVDDRKENLFSFKSLLMDMDVELICASSGVEALGEMLEHDFALAILDVQMPEMNGFELAQLMRGAEKTKTVPIIFVTAGVSSEINEFKGYESGAVDFLPKPLNPEILRCKVRIFLELARQKEKLNQKVAELERVSQEAAAAKEAAEQANRLKSSFLANMSHEIRTPLGALMGFAELLKNHPSKSQQGKYLDVILRNGKLLVQLIDEILDLSKIEAGHIEIETRLLEPKDLIQELHDLLRPLADKKGLDLKLRLSENMPNRIGTDPLRFRQILTNLLGNAIKFTKEGHVALTVDYKNSQIICEIQDTGIGISKELQGRLFQPFSQGDVSITRSFGGTGLGLSLSKKLAQLLGGDAQLKSSQPDQGSVFEVWIEDRKTSELKMGKECFGTPLDKVSEALSGTKILVVDDSPDNQLFVKMLLSENGAKVFSAENGKVGVKRALNEDFDLILMDLQMPVCDGIEATKALRKEGFKNPILALTANAMKEERDRCLNCGFNDYVSKPIDRRVLFSAMARSLSDQKESSKMTSSSSLS